MELSVLIVDDDPKIAEIHRHYTDKVEGFTVCGISDSLGDAVKMAEILEPDLILLDLYFPEGLGLDVLWKVRSERQACDVIMITAAKEIGPLQEAMRGGVFDYIVKPVMFPRFKEALDKFRTHRLRMQDGFPVDQQHIDQLLHPYRENSPGEPEHPKGIDPLTLRKVRIIFEKDYQDGFSAEEVSEKTGVSRTTARRYLEYLCANGSLTADLVYGAVGRPERRYFLL